MTKKIQFSFKMLLFMLLISCHDEGEDLVAFTNPMNTPQQILTISNRYVESLDILLNNYALSSIEYDYVERMWSVIYDSVPKDPVDFIGVFVADFDVSIVQHLP